MKNKKELTRSRTDSMVFGVMGGISEYFGISSTLVRIIYATLLIFSFGAPLFTFYIVLAFIVPKEPKRNSNILNKDNYYDIRKDSQKSSNNRKDVTKNKDEEDWSDF